MKLSIGYGEQDKGLKSTKIFFKNCQSIIKKSSGFDYRNFLTPLCDFSNRNTTWLLRSFFQKLWGFKHHLSKLGWKTTWEPLPCLYKLTDYYLVYPTERTKDRIFYDSDWISWLRFESWVRHFVKLLSKSHKIGLPSRVIWVVVVILWICSVLTKDHTPVIIVSALLRAKIWVSQVHWKFRPK